MRFLLKLNFDSSTVGNKYLPQVPPFCMGKENGYMDSTYYFYFSVYIRTWKATHALTPLFSSRKFVKIVRLWLGFYHRFRSNISRYLFVDPGFIFFGRKRSLKNSKIAEWKLQMKMWVFIYQVHEIKIVRTCNILHVAWQVLENFLQDSCFFTRKISPNSSIIVRDTPKYCLERRQKSIAIWNFVTLNVLWAKAEKLCLHVITYVSILTLLLNLSFHLWKWIFLPNWFFSYCESFFLNWRFNS